MSDNDRLPAELADVQSRLATVVPKGCSVNRDELMYRAGWAAASVQESRRLGSWAAGVLGAGLAAAATLAATNLLPSPDVGTTSVEHVASSGESVRSNHSPTLAEIATADRSRPKARRFDETAAPLLALRDRALRNELVDITASIKSENFASLEMPASMKQLRKELMPMPHPTLPAPSAPGPWQWLQSWSATGDTT
ncbi:hypothetical protein OAS39_12645 [Pirellulales bacterium]|nr:hypothetical protein [Pirellulales bacterium]